MRNLINKAQKTLLGNRRKGYTLPTNNKLYPAQWNWDSAFIALGYSYFNLNHALKEITTLLDGQWKDGMVPHILLHDTNTNYYNPYGGDPWSSSNSAGKITLFPSWVSHGTDKVVDSQERITIAFDILTEDGYN